MTELTTADPASHIATGIEVSRLVRVAPSRRALFAVGVVVSVGAAALATSSAGVAGVRADAGSELVMLLRFMAAIKAAMALGAIVLIGWRLGFAAPVTLALAYAVAAMAMAAAPVLIWQLAHVAIGAMLFHSGLIVLLGAAWIDRGDVVTLYGSSSVSQ